MKTLYQIVGLPTGNLDMLTREEFDRLYPNAVPSTNDGHLRPELQGQPVVPNMCGGMWGGWRDAEGNYVFLENDRDHESMPKLYSRNKGPIVAYVVRYETWETYEVLSR